jgi:hypothetical protein
VHGNRIFNQYSISFQSVFNHGANSLNIHSPCNLRSINAMSAGALKDQGILVPKISAGSAVIGFPRPRRLTKASLKAEGLRTSRI